MITLLYVDADPELSRFVYRIFEDSGNISVVLAESGEEALVRSARHPFDVIISDFYLPGINGIQLLQILRSRGISAPFIFFTHNFTTPLKGTAYPAAVFRFNGRNGLEKKQIMKLLRLIYWAVVSHVTEYPFIDREELLHDT